MAWTQIASKVPTAIKGASFTVSYYPGDSEVSARFAIIIEDQDGHSVATYGGDVMDEINNGKKEQLQSIMDILVDKANAELIP